jgi:formamidase
MSAGPAEAAMTRRHEIAVDIRRPVREQPAGCHNRWHPDIPAVLHCAPGDEVVMQTRDAVDGQLTRSSTHADVARTDRSVVHPLTGPVWIDGAEAGDVLAVEILHVEPSSFGYTAQNPGFGFLADEFPEPFLVRWDLGDGYATSPDLPGVAVPGAPFMGTMGVAPSRELLTRATAREQRLRGDDPRVLLPDRHGAVPADEPVASEGLRTKPPRENGGNLDLKQAAAGSRVLFPVFVDGALFSAGDAHFAQGDGEVCGTAIEMAAVLHVRFALLKRGGSVSRNGVRGVAVETVSRAGERSETFVTTGLSVSGDRGSGSDDLTAAARMALAGMLDHIVAEYGYSAREAYAIASVAVDLKLAQVVNSPACVASASLPLHIFDEARRTGLAGS